MLSGGRLLAALLLAATAGMPLGVRADDPLPATKGTIPASQAVDEALAFRRLVGRWNCVDAHGKRTDRSYVFEPPYQGEMALAGRETLRRDHDGSTTFVLEAFRWKADGIEATTFEGASAGTSVGETTLRLQGTDVMTEKPFTLTYVVDGGVLRRVVDEAGAANDERCTAVQPVVPTQPCTTPDRPARTLVAAIPAFVPEQFTMRLTGTVRVAVTLDDRSDLIAESIYSSPSALLNDSALVAARNTSYQTRVHDCRTVPQTYIFSVEFRSPT